MLDHIEKVRLRYIIFIARKAIEKNTLVVTERER
jgi:hypothetical protein